jgi:hypothetical protein
MTRMGRRRFAAAALTAAVTAPILGWSARATEPCPAAPAPPERDADATVPGATDNRVWYGDGRVTYTAPGGNTPTRSVDAGAGGADVRVAHDVGRVAVAASTDGTTCTDAAPGDGEVDPVLPAAPAPDPEHPSVALGLVPGYDDVPPPLAWHAPTQVQEVWFPSRATGARLHGVAIAPDPLPKKPVPVIVILPGSGPGVAKTQNWIGRALAGSGYLTLIVEPQGVGHSETFDDTRCGAVDGSTDPANPCPGVPWQQADNYLDGVLSGVDHATSPSYPWAGLVRRQRHSNVAGDRIVGVNGYSLSARAASYAQGIPEGAKIDAVVAFDNLASDLAGDAGSASGGPPLGTVIGGELPGDSRPVTPRVPSMGQASETTQSPADAKVTAQRLWRAAGVDAMEVVFEGTAHTDWSQGLGGELLPKFAHYAEAWFDRYLLADPTATSRLLSRNPFGEDVRTVLADRFLSAVWMDGGAIACDDLRAGCSSVSS